MAGQKRKAVINAEQSQLDQIQGLIDEERYRTVSEFVREAVAEKLERVVQDRVAECVERYCASGHAAEDADLIERQAQDRSGDRPIKRGRHASR